MVLLEAHQAQLKAPSTQVGRANGKEAESNAAAALAAAAKRLAEHFPEPDRAAEHLQKLLQLKDKNVFRGLKRLADEAHVDKVLCSLNSLPRS